ncbi:MAG: exosortase-associated EpsI family protein [Akkermansia sp.]
MKKLLYSILPPLVLCLILSGIYLLPQSNKLQESAIKPELPLGYGLPGWYGERTQESAEERSTLSADTIFSKGVYTTSTSNAPAVYVSIVYSGNDMNSSIHRPERCLPAQGHFNLNSTSDDITLDNGKTITFTRLCSSTGYQGNLDQKLSHINYYVFVGHESICSTHIDRTRQDMYDRVMKGYVQRWAYYQIGSYWGEPVGIDEETCDKNLRAVIQKLTPPIVDWTALEGTYRAAIE